MGSAAFASAEVIAALRGKPGADLPEEVSTWVAKQRSIVDASVLTLAVQAVEIVLNDPAFRLRELWNEAAEEDRDAWRPAITGLIERLR